MVILLTFEQAKGIVATAVGADKSNALDVAESHLLKAITKLSRMNNVNFNREWVTFTLTAGKSSYKIGSDVLSEYMDIKKIQHIWHNDRSIEPIKVLGIDEYKSNCSGLSSTGVPVIATVHSSDPILEVYPVPDSNYSVSCYVKRKINKFEDIDSAYHDVVVDYALLSVSATKDPNVAIRLFEEGIDDLKYDSMVGWIGNNIPVSRHMGIQTDRANSDSGNLRP